MYGRNLLFSFSYEFQRNHCPWLFSHRMIFENGNGLVYKQKTTTKNIIKSFCIQSSHSSITDKAYSFVFPILA